MTFDQAQQLISSVHELTDVMKAFLMVYLVWSAVRFIFGR